jgi:uncharacterized OB-fold protein
MDLRIPIPDSLSEEYWAAAANGTLLIQQCGTCSRVQFYPRGHCVSCLQPDPQWLVASGHGTLHSFSVVRRTPNTDWADEVPYVYALVDLEERVRVTTNIVGTDPATLECGQPVEIVFVERDGFHIPCATASDNERTSS